MHNAEAAIEPAFYDHQDDDVVQRDRVAADWGADEVFASVPRRRLRGDQHATAAARRSPARRVSGPALEDDGDAAERAAWLAGVEAELAAEAMPATEASPAPAEAMRPEELTDGIEFDAPAAWTEEPAGRRTVTITGHPGRALAPAIDRRRPPRTVDERIGGRPDRVAGWAFGMGLLLIVVAAVS
jgi:hypothetical protein